MAQKEVNQPRQYHDEEGSYQLPNDAQEHQRLDKQAAGVRQLMQGKLFHAQLSKPKKIIDIGCGTGVATSELGLLFPDAQVCGVDISPVPQLHDKPPNVTYVQGDIKQLARSGDPRFAPGSFDFVFHRFLFLGMTDWSDYIHVVGSLLASGGWVELQEVEIFTFAEDGSSKTDHWWFWPYFAEDCNAIGLDLTIGRKLTEMLRSEGGFSNIAEDTYRWPTAYDPSRPETVILQDYMSKATKDVGRLLVRKVCAPRRDEDMLEQLVADARSRFEDQEPGDHARFFVVRAQKTED